MYNSIMRQKQEKEQIKLSHIPTHSWVSGVTDQHLAYRSIDHQQKLTLTCLHDDPVGKGIVLNVLKRGRVCLKIVVLFKTWSPTGPL